MQTYYKYHQVHFRDSHDKIVPSGDFCVEDLLTGDDEDGDYTYENFEEENSGCNKDYLILRFTNIKCLKLYLKTSFTITQKLKLVAMKISQLPYSILLPSILKFSKESIKCQNVNYFKKYFNISAVHKDSFNSN